MEEQLYAEIPLSPSQSTNSQSQDTGPILYQELHTFASTGPVTEQTSPTVVRTVTVI